MSLDDKNGEPMEPPVREQPVAQTLGGHRDDLETRHGAIDAPFARGEVEIPCQRALTHHRLFGDVALPFPSTTVAELNANVTSQKF